MQLQILMSLNRLDALAEPLRALIDGTPAAERPALIAGAAAFRAARRRQAPGGA